MHKKKTQFSYVIVVYIHTIRFDNGKIRILKKKLLVGYFKTFINC